MDREQFRKELANIGKQAEDIVETHIRKKAEMKREHSLRMERTKAQQEAEIEVLEAQNLHMSRGIRFQERMIRDRLMQSLQERAALPTNASPHELSFDELRDKYLGFTEQNLRDQCELKMPAWGPQKSSEQYDPNGYGSPYKIAGKAGLDSKPSLAPRLDTPELGPPSSSLGEAIWSQSELEALARVANSNMELCIDDEN